MINVKEQMNLLMKVRKNRSKFQATERPASRYNDLLIFFKKNKAIILGTVALFFTQGIIETSLILISRDKLSFIDHQILGSFFWELFIFFLAIFIVNSFLSIKQEKTIVVLFINSLRRRIFKNYLGQPLEDMKSEKQADLIAKISYHLPLVSMGISNSFFGLIRWLIYLISALVVAFFAGLNVPLIGSALLVLSVIIAITAYFTVKQYVSQEVTFYSQIIKHIDLSLSEKYFSKKFNLEPAILKKFDRLVKFDSIFRIRRDLWMKMVFKIIFALLLVISVSAHIFYSDLSSWINLIRPELKFLYAFLMIYLSRVVIEALRVGLYFFPAKLGLSLANIQTNKHLHRHNFIDIKQEIIFYSRKTKLFKAGKYYRDLKFNFLKAGRYLFYGANFSGKTTLAKLFLGAETYNSKAIKIKIDGVRMDFASYQKNFNKVYFFDPNFYSQKSLMEIILGSDREETDFPEIEQAIKIISAQPELAGLIAADDNFSATSDKIWNNRLAAFALHALHCLVKKPSLIIIDNLWLDLDYPDIDKILKIINQGLPESIIIIFANKNINNLNYDQRYDLDHNFTSEKQTEKK